MSTASLTETLSEPLGPIASGPYAFFYREHRWTERGEPWAPQYEVLADLRPRRCITVQRQGGLCEGDWGVDVDLRTDGYAVAPAEARSWAHAVLAAVDLAERLARGGTETFAHTGHPLDRILDEALNYLCDADNLAAMTAVPRDVGDLLRHSIAEAVKRLESVEVLLPASL